MVETRVIDDIPPTDPRGSSIPPPPLDLIESMVRRVFAEVLSAHATEEMAALNTIRANLSLLIEDRHELHQRVAQLETRVARLEHTDTDPAPAEGS
jgi:hypothetical protein